MLFYKYIGTYLIYKRSVFMNNNDEEIVERNNKLRDI